MTVQASKRGPGRYSVFEGNLVADVELGSDHGDRAWYITQVRYAATGEVVSRERCYQQQTVRSFSTFSTAKWAAHELLVALRHEDEELAAAAELARGLAAPGARIVGASVATTGKTYAFKQGPYDLSNVVRITRFIRANAAEGAIVEGDWFVVDKQGLVHGNLHGEGHFDLSDDLVEVNLEQAPALKAAIECLDSDRQQVEAAPEHGTTCLCDGDEACRQAEVAEEPRTYTLEDGTKVQYRTLGQLVDGDIVRQHGLRLLIDCEVVVLDDHPSSNRGWGVVRSTRGLVLNIDEVVRAASFPLSYLERTDLRTYRWTLQGNDLADFAVEV